MRPETTPSLRCHWLTRLRLICNPPVVRKALLAAGVVGTLLVALNQGDVLLAGTITPLVLAKVLVTPCVPFCVSLCGAYAAYRSALTNNRKRQG